MGADAKVWAEFSIRGDEFDPHEMTEAIAIPPTYVWQRGELRFPNSPLRWNDFGWCLTTDRESVLERSQDPSIELERRIEQVVSVLLPHRDVIKRFLKDGNEAFIEGVARVDHWNIEPRLAPSVLREIADVGATLVFDIYLFPSNDGPPASGVE